MPFKNEQDAGTLPQGRGVGVRDATAKALSPVKSTTIGKTAMPKVWVADVSFKNRARSKRGS